MSLEAFFVKAKKINDEIKEQGFCQEKKLEHQTFCLYDEIIQNSLIRECTRKLFLDGHHAQAVEQAYKCIDNFVKKQSGEANTGSALMKKVFSANSPLISFNSLLTQSERDEQLGFMEILSGCMTGIRNPRAHESQWEDTEKNALYLICFADYLINKISNACTNYRTNIKR